MLFRIHGAGSADGFEGENAELDSRPLGGARLEKGSCRGCALFSAEASPGISVPAAARQPDGGREQAQDPGPSAQDPVPRAQVLPRSHRSQTNAYKYLGQPSLDH